MKTSGPPANGPAIAPVVTIRRLVAGILLAGAMVFSPWLPLAAAEDAMVYPEMRTASGFSRFMQNVTGFTPLSGWLANRVLKRELNRHVKGELRSRLTLISGTDLLGGKARGIRISGRGVLLEDFIPLSEFEFESQADSPLYVSRDRRPILLRPMVFKVWATLREDDLNQMLQSERGRKLLTDIKVKIPPFGKHRLDLLSPRVDIDGDGVVIESLLNTHGAPLDNALPVTVRGKIAAERSKLKLSDLKLDIEGVSDTEDIARLIENYFGDIVNLNKIKVDRHRLKVAIERSELGDNQLKLAATVTVEPDRKAIQRYLANLAGRR